LGDRVDSGRGLLVLADPEVVEGPGEAGASHEGAAVTSSFIRHRSGDYGAAAREFLQDTDFLPLPGAREEAECVAAAWRKTSSEPLALYLAADATEQRFKAEAPGKRVIHLATHGFFLPTEGEGRANGGGHSPVSMTNPLLMTGLILADASRNEATPDEAIPDDGILTAYEVSAMDLAGVELAVLSACETGLGTIEDGEGVYGLRRAFQYAGARSVISTLWPLSDEAVTSIMIRIYTETESSLPERLRSAQMEMLAHLRSKGEPDHPYTWAGLILTGARD
jgi:CHAT domain-containing protein